MDKSMLAGILLGAGAVTAAGGYAGYKAWNENHQYAEVLHVQEVMKRTRIPREVCNDEVVTHQAPAKDPNRIAGTAIGAVVGGVVGNQVGAGSGRTLATAAGAVAGGYAGNKIQANMQASNTYSTRETRCRTVYDTQERRVGFDVTYRLGDEKGVVRMDHDPGDRIPVKDGQLVLTNAQSGNPS